MCWKNFQICGAHILRKCINLGIFTHVSPHSKLAPKFLTSHPRQRKLLIPLENIFSKMCFPQQKKEVEETMISFIKIQSENMKMAWDITLFIFYMICNFFKCDGFTVL